MVKFFINRPIFATVLALIIVVAGGRTDGSANRRFTDRATGKRRGRYALHEFKLLQFGGLLPNDHLRRGNGYRHGDRHGAKPGEYRPEQLAGTRDRTRYHHPQAILQYRDDAYPKFQGFHLRRVVFK